MAEHATRDVAAARLFSGLWKHPCSQYGKCSTGTDTSRLSEVSSSGVHGSRDGNGDGRLSSDVEREAGPEASSRAWSRASPGPGVRGPAERDRGDSVRAVGAGAGTGTGRH